jgi:hypothetical protein
MFEPTYTFIKVKEEQKKRYVSPYEVKNNDLLLRNNIFTNFTYRDHVISNGKRIIAKNNQLYKDA